VRVLHAWQPGERVFVSPREHSVLPVKYHLRYGSIRRVAFIRALVDFDIYPDHDPVWVHLVDLAEPISDPSSPVPLRHA
jgi:hypothetical protein